eukprot:750572-Hanusia_phi.AAC.3
MVRVTFLLVLLLLGMRRGGGGGGGVAAAATRISLLSIARRTITTGERGGGGGGGGGGFSAVRIRGGSPSSAVPAPSEEEAESPLRAKILALEKERDRIEEEIKKHADFMEQIGAPAHVSGEFWKTHTPLIDREGYPRSDIPVLEVGGL